MAEVYDIDVEVMVQEGEDAALRTHRTDRTHVGLDQHIDNEDKEGSNSHDNSYEDSPTKDKSVSVASVKHASYVSYASQTQTVAVKPRVYFLGGKYHCENCNDKGDKFYMNEHPCNGKKKESRK